MTTQPYFELPLTRGMVALVDEADRSTVERYSWSACQSSNHWYARARIPGDPVIWERLHRFLCGLQPGDKRVVDHISGNTLDYRRENLRVVTSRQNQENRTRPQRNSKAGFIRVESHYSGKFVARIKRNGVRRYLGIFITQELARSAYLEAANAM